MATSTSVFSRLRGSAWLHPFNDRAALDRLLQQINPLWSTDQVRARVLAVQGEADDAISLLLQPNRHWRGHRAGQHVLLDIENHHNFAWKEEPDGQEVVVHRKGATPAGAGVLGIIPGSMASPTYVVRGLGNPESMRSAAHGEGRVMRRAKAKKKEPFPRGVLPRLRTAERPNRRTVAPSLSTSRAK